jgi:DNA-binding ferritin-like protein
MPVTRKHKHTKRNSKILTGRPAAVVRGGKRGEVSMIVSTFLEMLNTVKLYHWKTKCFAAHKASDELYGTLNEKIDELVEVMLGKAELGGRAKLLNVTGLKLSMTSSDEVFKKQIEAYKTFLINMTSGIGSVPANADLLAIRDEILAAMNQFLYLLTLN